MWDTKKYNYTVQVHQAITVKEWLEREEFGWVWLAEVEWQQLYILISSYLTIPAKYQKEFAAFIWCLIGTNFSLEHIGTGLKSPELSLVPDEISSSFMIMFRFIQPKTVIGESECSAKASRRKAAS